MRTILVTGSNGLLGQNLIKQLAKNNMGFWSAFTKFRKILEQEDLKITDADFKDLRDISTGREREIFK